MRVLFVTGITLAVLCSAVHAQMYRWVDKDGRVHYTQTPPPADAKGVQKMSGAGSASTGPAASTDLPYATQVAAKNSPVTLYTTPDCGAPCDQARALLVRRGVPFREISVQDQKAIDEVTNLAGNPQVPLLIVGAQKQAGFLEEAYDSLLTAAGYPASGPRLPVEALRKMNTPPAPQNPVTPTPGSPDTGGNPGEQMK